jgi:hypothetical protein
MTKKKTTPMTEAIEVPEDRDALIKTYEEDVELYKMAERRGWTYNDLQRLRHPFSTPSKYGDIPFNADEDLVFLYNELWRLYSERCQAR